MYIIKKSIHVELAQNLHIKIGKFRGYFKLHREKYFKYIHFKMHTLLATNDINNIFLTAGFTINTIFKFRTIQNHSRQWKSYQTPKHKNKYQKSLQLKSSNNMAKY